MESRQFKIYLERMDAFTRTLPLDCQLALYRIHRQIFEPPSQNDPKKEITDYIDMRISDLCGV